MNLQLLKKLNSIHSVSGDVGGMVRFLCEYLDDLGVEYVRNGYGSIILGCVDGLEETGDNEKKIRAVGARRMFAAHIDDVGFQVTKINEDGTMSVLPIGWVFPNRLEHQLVYVMGRKMVPGFIYHNRVLRTESVDSFSDLVLNVGMGKSEVEKAGVKPGCTGSFAMNYHETKESVMASGLDNRISIFTLLELIKEDRKFLKDTVVAFITDEEMRDHGANGIGYEYRVPYVFVLDYVPAHQERDGNDVIPSVGNGAFVAYRGGDWIIHEEMRNLFDNLEGNFQKVFISPETMPCLEPDNYENNGISKAVNVFVPALGYHGASYIAKKSDIKSFYSLVRQLMVLEI